MNKKAAVTDSDKALFLTIFVLGGIMALTYFIFFMIPSLVDAHVGISPELQQNIYMNTLINSPNCFAYQEPISRRVINGYIDYNKVTENTLQDCLDLRRRTEQGVFVEIYKGSLDGDFIKEIHSLNALERMRSSKIEYIKPIILVKNNEYHNAVMRFTFY